MPATTLDLRSDLARRLSEARARTDRFFDLIAESALYERAIPERHRLVFYLGHLEAFDWNLVGRQVFDAPAFSPEFDHLFAFVIDPVDGQLPSDVPADWPSLTSVRAYRDQVRADRRCLARFDPNPRLLLGADTSIEHRLRRRDARLHAAAPAARGLPAARAPRGQPGPLERATAARAARARCAASRFRGPALGMPRERLRRDNELGEHVVDVPAFTIDAQRPTASF
jgi:hypothetical protein